MPYDMPVPYAFPATQCKYSTLNSLSSCDTRQGKGEVTPEGHESSVWSHASALGQCALAFASGTLLPGSHEVATMWWLHAPGQVR